MSSVTKRLGRPEKADGERRTKQVETWLSPGEHEHYLASAGKESPADYLRGLALQDWAPTALQQSGRLGRPPQARRVQIRVTFAEKEQICSLAAECELTVSDYLRLSLVVHSGFDAEQHVLRLEVRPGLGKKLAELAASRNLTIAEYVLQQAEETPVAESPKGNRVVVDPALLMRLDQVKHALDRIGNNVNQIAKAAHVGRDLPGLSEAAGQELTAERKRAADILEEIASHYEH